VPQLSSFIGISSIPTKLCFFVILAELTLFVVELVLELGILALLVVDATDLPFFISISSSYSG